MSVRFIHVRAYEHALSLDPHPCGGITIAYDINGDTISYATARCADKEHYNKKIGRMVAGGRLAAERGIVKLLVEQGRTATNTIVSHFADHYEELVA